MPKLLGVSTMPRPMCQRQRRFAITLAVIGCLMIDSARSSRPLPFVKSTDFCALKIDGKPRGASGPNEYGLPRRRP